MLNKIKNKLKKTINRLDDVYVFGSPISIFRFLKILYDNIISFDLDQRATSVAFSFLLAVFPAILCLFTIIPYIPVEDLDVQILQIIKGAIPAGLFDVVEHTIVEIISRPRGDILSLGFIFALYAATNGINSLTTAFNVALEKQKARSFVKSKGVAILVLLLLLLILVVTVLFLIIGKIVLSYIIEHSPLDSEINFLAIKLLGYTAILFTFYFAIACLYYFAPNYSEKIPFFNVGALFTSIFGIIATNIFSFYLENFNNYNKLYGSIGTLIAIMVWIYIICLILILGFELNVGLREEKNRLAKNI